MTDFNSVKDAIKNSVVNLFGDNNYGDVIVVEETKKRVQR